MTTHPAYTLLKLTPDFPPHLHKKNSKLNVLVIIIKKMHKIIVKRISQQTFIAKIAFIIFMASFSDVNILSVQVLRPETFERYLFFLMFRQSSLHFITQKITYIRE